MNANDTIKITGAHEHNLKNLNLEIPKNNSARYKALGNAIALPCIEYIMAGIKEEFLISA